MGKQEIHLEAAVSAGYRSFMSVEQIKNRLQNGFHPFTLQLSNGHEYPVPHRDFIAVHPKVVVVIGREGISHTINPLHIVSIDETVREG